MPVFEPNQKGEYEAHLQNWLRPRKQVTVPIVKRTTIGAPKPRQGSSPEKPRLTLPYEPSETVGDINEYSFLIHGEKKIGKTTLLTVEDNVLLLTFDPLQKALAIRQRHVPDWDSFMSYLQLLETAAQGKAYPYKRIVIDGVDIWYRRCQTWVEKKLLVGHVSEEKWGKGWDMLKSMFANAVDRLLALPGGCWFISHSTWREVETRDAGRKIEKLLPLLKAGGEEILVGKVDGWFAYDYVGSQRILIVRGDERTGAGNRCKGHFLTPKNEPVKEVPMGESEEEGWMNLVSAFENKQTFTTVNHEEARQPVAKKGDNGRTSIRKPLRITKSA